VLVADFEVDNIGLGISIANNTLGDPDVYHWDFGDGTISKEKDPKHRYWKEGIYQICLKVEDDCSKHSFCDTIEVHQVSLDDNEFEFEEIDLDVNFFNKVKGDPDSFHWDFGDGNTSFEANPSHSYEKAGTYTVCLQLDNSFKTNANCKEITVSKTGPAQFPVKDMQVSIIPNLTNGYFELLIHAEQQDEVEILLFDETGKKLYQEEFVLEDDQFQKSFNLDKEPHGIYFVVVKNGDQILTRRLVLQK